MAFGLYSIFHCNIAFSSIEEDKRPDVVKRCYWPLLKLARRHKIAIEANGYTLEVVERIDPAWIEELKTLIKTGQVEFLGSGYVQMVGPVVPARITKENLRIGQKVYRELLGAVPRIAYLNEQTYSASMPALYRTAGYEALVADWNNPAHLHLEWDSSWQYRLCRAKGTTANIPLIWSNYIAFQKFQRYAHGEMPLKEYLDYLRNHAKHGGVFPLYANDAEVFDFRPGRFGAEPPQYHESEWGRIEKLYDTLSAEKKFKLLQPHELLPASGRSPLLSLETTAFPISVKKQEKYNPIRWTLGGRDDISINTDCYRILRMLEKCPPSPATTRAWKDLCYAWDSDFRTHITLKRFEEYRLFLTRLEKNVMRLGGLKRARPAKKKNEARMHVQTADGVMTLSHPRLKASLIIRRGLAINELFFPTVHDLPLVRTLPHGYYHDVPLGADYYSGNTKIEIAGKMNVTDLEPAEDISIQHTAAGTQISVLIKTHAGSIRKKLLFKPSVPSITLSYDFDLSLSGPLSFRTGNVTLNPEAFKRKTLFYRTHNGGIEPETFSLRDAGEIDVRPLNILCSARTALGNTEGLFECGDSTSLVTVRTRMHELAALPMVMYRTTKESYFFRIMYSLQEFDDTIAVRGDQPFERRHFTVEISARKPSRRS